MMCVTVITTVKWKEAVTDFLLLKVLYHVVDIPPNAASNENYTSVMSPFAGRENKY
jgi:hypothetical protein